MPRSAFRPGRGEGVETLRDWLLRTAGWKPHGEGLFMARERHLVALRSAAEALTGGGKHRKPLNYMQKISGRRSKRSVGSPAK